MQLWNYVQQALVIVAGDALAFMAAFFLAGAFLLSAWHVVTAALQRYSA